MERKRDESVDLVNLSMDELDRIAQDSYAEMLALIEAGQAPSQRYFEASIRYAQAAVTYRMKAGEMMQRYNQVSDAFGLDEADALVK